MESRILTIDYDDDRRYFYTLSPDKKVFTKHLKTDFKVGETVDKGFCANINSKLYGLFRDEQDLFWLVGEDIEPLLITPEVTAELVGLETDETERTLTIRVKGEIYLQRSYFRDLNQIFLVMWVLETDGDCGYYIWSCLNSEKQRAIGWTRHWSKEFNTNDDPVVSFLEAEKQR